MSKCINSSIRLFFTTAIFFLSTFLSLAQFSIHGTYDAYLASSRNAKDSLPFMVSSAAINQMDLNLLELEFRYETKLLTAHLAPAVGSYMRKNYSTELPWRRNIYEGYLEAKWKKSKIALGSFSSPYTQETPRGVDQLSYSRSLAAEYVPYYVAGLRWSQDWSSQFSTQFFITNSWQRLSLSGVRPSLGALLQWKFDTWNLNWSHFYGDLAPIGKLPPVLAQNRWRFFQEINANKKVGNLAFQACAYLGLQRHLQQNYLWGQVNVQLQKEFDKHFSVSSRFEYFYDPQQVLSTFDQGGFGSFSVGYLKEFAPVLQLGQELRYFAGSGQQIPVLYSFLRLKF
ncbi:MAG: hypothetical protein RLZZ65_250 [Bacteroidota bacterium]|jgi:hypothetical protein